jgi:hypothetical protein
MQYYIENNKTETPLQFECFDCPNGKQIAEHFRALARGEKPEEEEKMATGKKSKSMHATTKEGKKTYYSYCKVPDCGRRTQKDGLCYGHSKHGAAYKLPPAGETATGKKPRKVKAARKIARTIKPAANGSKDYIATLVERRDTAYNDFRKLDVVCNALGELTGAFIPELPK